MNLHDVVAHVVDRRSGYVVGETVSRPEQMVREMEPIEELSEEALG